MVDNIIKFENGELSEAEEILFFSELIRTGVIFNLQGFYQRHAKSMIESGILDTKGNVLIELE
jgi:hypothetical protein